jgi:pimeloyl-ACP methyl ester carboxylesterase
MQIEVNGISLFVDIDGAALVPDGPTMKERPTLMLLHGGPGQDHSSFKAELAELRDVAQLVYVDHRGNGRSGRGDKALWTLDQWADDVKGLCDVLGIEKPIVLGQSFGGFVAQAYGIKYPDHPGKLIFSSTSARKNQNRCNAVFERLGGKEARDIADRAWKNPCPETLEPFRKTCLPLYNQSNGNPDKAKRAVKNEELLLHFQGSERKTFDFLEGLSRLKCPVLVLGGEDDPTTPIEDQEDITAAIPTGLATFHRFAGCGHGAWRDKPQDVIPVIRAFISAV